MMALALNQQDFDTWLDQKTLEYASETRHGERLRMIVHVRTNTATVTHGERVLYDGTIETALKTFPLDQQDFDAWFNTQTLEYASETRRGERLCFILHVRTNTALVTHGERVLYEGSIESAIAAYNAA